MKKIFIAVLAVAALASCSKEQTVNVDKGAVIGFDTFVENSTRANDLVKGAFDFGVFGLVEKGGANALIFNNQTVAADGTYSPAQYWIASAQYYFTAIAPYSNAEWEYETTTAHTGTISFNNAAAQANQDLLFAYNKPEKTPAEITTAPAKVGFTFKHILSKIAFKFENTFADGNTSLKVYNVKIKNTAKKGTMAINAGVDQNWTAAETDENKLVVAFGEAAAVNVALFGNGESFPVAHQYIIPAEREYVITFDVDLYQAGVYLATYNHEIKKTINFAKNGNYSLNVKLAPDTVNPEAQLYPIEFEVTEITDWDNDHDGKENTAEGDTDGDNQVDTELN